MSSTLTNRNLTDNQVANVVINAIFDSGNNGTSEVSSIINEDSAFVNSPAIDASNNGEFGMIVLVGNLSFLESTFEADQAERVENIIFDKVSKMYEMDTNSFRTLVREYQSFIMRVNHPSKNWIYGMSKALFHKYNLNECQDEYFRRMQAPNPLFLKRMDEVMSNFIWNWDAFFKKYRI